MSYTETQPTCFAGQADDTSHCIACDKPMQPGDRYYPDASGGEIHAACCGPEREAYTRDGEPLGPNDPMPEPSVWEDAQ